MGHSRRFNPFYVLLVAAGILFALTACAYGVMTFTALRDSGEKIQRSSLIEFMEARGGTLLAVELAVLAVATVGAIATDGYWQQRGRASGQHDSNSNSGGARAP